MDGNLQVQSRKLQSETMQLELLSYIINSFFFSAGEFSVMLLHVDTNSMAHARRNRQKNTHTRAKQKPKTKNSGLSTKVSENTEQKREVCTLKMNLCCFFIFINDYAHLDICNLQILFCTYSKKSHRYFINLKINFDGDEKKNERQNIEGKHVK